MLLLPNQVSNGTADYEYIFQITDDPKAHLKIIHGGGIYFAKNSKTNDWIAHCDFL